MRLVSRSTLTSDSRRHKFSSVRMHSKPSIQIKCHCHQVRMSLQKPHSGVQPLPAQNQHNEHFRRSIMNWRQHRMRWNRNFNCFAFSNLIFIYIETLDCSYYTRARTSAQCIGIVCAPKWNLLTKQSNLENLTAKSENAGGWWLCYVNCLCWRSLCHSSDSVPATYVNFRPFHSTKSNKQNTLICVRGVRARQRTTQRR